MRSDSVLAGLKETSQVAAHCGILSRSVLRDPAAVKGSSTIIKRLVSSANNRILEPMSFTISLIYNRKRRGPKMEPWGTPAQINFQSKTAPGNITRCFLSQR